MSVEREPDYRKLTLMMTEPINTNLMLVLEKDPDWTPENPKWHEVPATVEAVYENPDFVLTTIMTESLIVEEATGG